MAPREHEARVDVYGETRSERTSDVGEPREADQPSQGELTRDETTGPPRVGRYTVLESIGAGAMGVVYSAYEDQRSIISMICDFDST